MEERVTATKIGRNEYLMRDSRQMWLAKKRKGKNGDEYVRTSGYYTHFETFFRGLASEGILQAGGEDMTEALNALVKLEQDIQATAKKIGKALDEKESEDVKGLV